VLQKPGCVAFLAFVLKVNLARSFQIGYDDCVLRLSHLEVGSVLSIIVQLYLL